MPQNFYLGDNLNYYNIVADVENIEFFEKEINNFFGKEIKFPQIQKSEHKFKIELKKDQKIKIKKIYEKDFDLLKIL